MSVGAQLCVCTCKLSHILGIKEKWFLSTEATCIGIWEREREKWILPSVQPGPDGCPSVVDIQPCFIGHVCLCPWTCVAAIGWYVLTLSNWCWCTIVQIRLESLIGCVVLGICASFWLWMCVCTLGCDVGVCAMVLYYVHFGLALFHAHIYVSKCFSAVTDVLVD